MTAYEIWLSFNNREEVLQLPVTPFFEIETEQGVSTLTLQELGEISVPGLKKLKRLTLDSFFPHPSSHYKFTVYDNYPVPWDCVDLIGKWEKSRRPIRVIITGTRINLAMLIKSFKSGVKDGTQDVSYHLDLIEYPFLDAPKLATVNGTTGANAVAGSKKGAKEWKVVYGDTWCGISKAVYGTDKYWKAIIDANPDLKPKKDTLKNIEGQTLVLPSEYDVRDVVTGENAKYDSSNIPRKWKLKAGDTLAGIAVLAYNNASLWKLIADANKDIIKTPTTSLKDAAGREIIIPVYSENTALVEG